MGAQTTNIIVSQGKDWDAKGDIGWPVPEMDDYVEIIKLREIKIIEEVDMKPYLREFHKVYAALIGLDRAYQGLYGCDPWIENYFEDVFNQGFNKEELKRLSHSYAENMMRLSDIVDPPVEGEENALVKIIEGVHLAGLHSRRRVEAPLQKIREQKKQHEQ